MLQQVMTNPGEIIFREVPVPEVKENQVLVKIMNIGICGSDTVSYTHLDVYKRQILQSRLVFRYFF